MGYPWEDQQPYPDNEIVKVIDESGHKKKKDKLKKDAPLEVTREGYILEPIDTSNLAKGRLDWSRVSRQQMKFSNAKLSEISRKAFAVQQMGPMSVFATLTTDQRRVITRLIEGVQLNEKEKDAEWDLECVRRYTKKLHKNSFFQPSPVAACVRLMVILKRQDKHAGKDGRIPVRPSTFQPDEIIDLSVPSNTKVQRKVKEDTLDPFAEFGLGAGITQHELPGQDSGPFPGVPQGAIAVSDWPQPPPPPQIPIAYPNNPFNAAYDPPRMEQRLEAPFDPRAYTPAPIRRDNRSASRSRSRRRRDEAREREDRDRDRELDRLRREKDDLFDRMGRYNIRDSSPRSSEDSYRQYWSSASGGSITPPSSPSMSDYASRRKLYRHNGPSRRYRDEDTLVEPYRNDDRRRGREREERIPAGILRIPASSSHRQGRALLHQDDYPSNPFAAQNRRALPEVPGEGFYPAEFNNRRRRSRMREVEPVYRGDQRDAGRRARAWI
ncbi:unnamed protein product [Zymoseptoria tritici ST99CH_1A5]|uniref:Uncharacterized protein n=2 Tax=Zymoseptoria tritici TaxID=1047171 RepID=A0A1X7RKG0_ZYMT9|nr:unnamed protein product [Zymoseptoria tritici ST99CH_3D7]SMR47686.1 unnamed protein product [Zymoseptoria tritici ST99CH_3D1]SMY21590.1 unnamed protein product [Zymoseptoria tritici ST99CH_1A5]